MPAEAQLLRDWVETTGLGWTEVARRVKALSGVLAAPHRFLLPESTLRNMKKGIEGALKPGWRLAAVGLVCGGHPNDLIRAGRADAAAELRYMIKEYDDARAAIEARTHWARPESVEVSLPASGQLVVPVPADLTPQEREIVRLAAVQFAESLRQRRSGE
ncbi:hypothetical protein ABZ470_39825 [Streptosporangium sp. NPDC020072]|uniref:hypothetical protein n=1 Tax=Streptosporangium sp. NPDC020072 TaxID=3154788 RepID=UPI003430E830